MQVDADTIAGALDVDLRNACTFEFALHHATDGNIFLDEVRVTLTRLGRIGEPAGAVVRRDAETEPCGVNLLTHLSDLFLLVVSANYHGDVGGALQNAACAALGAGLEPFHGWPFVYPSGANNQILKL